jgi:CDP-glycerol glycerophosphotransferase (TagB/SpsB family)
LDNYLERNRKMYFDYELYTPGRKFYNFTELIEALKNKRIIENLNYPKQRQEMLNKFWTKDTATASKEIASFTKHNYLRNSQNGNNK